MKEQFRSVSPKSFSKRDNFPGLTGNPFDRVLHKMMIIEKIPFILILCVLAGISYLLGRFEISKSLIIVAFFLTDYLLLFCLPVFKISYGPIKPTFIILAILRSVFWLLPFQISFWLEVCGILLILYGFYCEPGRLSVSYQTVQSAKLPPASSIKILHLGDLHVERFTRRERRVLEKIKDLQPDLILFSGDLLNLSYLDDQVAKEAVRKFLNSLSAPRGVFGVSGSPAVDLPSLFPQLVDGTPLVWLNDQRIEIPLGEGRISITGLTCTHKPDVDFERLKNIAASNENDFAILLYHTPDIAPLSCQMEYDLQLSGHTHGGQVCLPLYGALFAGSLYGKTFESGRYLLNHMVLYVTRGIGLEGAAAPRVRFLCPPEITLWKISSLS